MKSNPVKVSGKLFRYDFDHSVVEYIIKADAETISEENEWKRKYGSPLFCPSVRECNRRPWP